jgi:hypothetical protein
MPEGIGIHWKKKTIFQTWVLVAQTLILPAEEEQSGGLYFEIIRRIMFGKYFEGTYLKNT